MLELLRAHGAGAQSLSNKLAEVPQPKRQLGSSLPSSVLSQSTPGASPPPASDNPSASMRREASLELEATMSLAEESAGEERSGRTPKLRRAISVKSNTSISRSPRKASKTRRSRTRSKTLTTSLLLPKSLEIEVSAAEPSGRSALFDTAASMTADSFKALTAPPGDIMAHTNADVVVLFLVNSYILEELSAHEVSLFVPSSNPLLPSCLLGRCTMAYRAPLLSS